MDRIRQSQALLEALKSETVGKDYLLENGIEALEKQVPKKPVTRKAEERTEVRYHVIPLSRLREVVDPAMDYCDGCGQRISWIDRKKDGPR